MTAPLIDLCVRITALADALTVPDGGFTVDPTTGADIADGYAVAVHPECERVFERAVTSADLCAYVADFRDSLCLPGRALGGWRDPATGRVHLDVSVVTAQRQDAMRLAQDTQQLAIFDFAAMASVPVAA